MPNGKPCVHWLKWGRARRTRNRGPVNPTCGQSAAYPILFGSAAQFLAIDPHQLARIVNGVVVGLALDATPAGSFERWHAASGGPTVNSETALRGYLLVAAPIKARRRTFGYQFEPRLNGRGYMCCSFFPQSCLLRFVLFLAIFLILAGREKENEND